MTAAEWGTFALGAAVGGLSLPLLFTLLRALCVELEDGHAALICSFGKLERTITAPGLHVLPARALPWVSVKTVSLQRDFRHIKDIYVNDARGTTVIVDLWVEFRVSEPARALFQVADWDGSLQNLLSHATTALLGDRDFQDILCARDELGHQLERDVRPDTERWGLRIDQVFIRNVRLLPEVSRQMFEMVAARLERAKASMEEQGRLRVAELEAQTAARVAGLLADAKGQYLQAIDRAFQQLSLRPEVLAAYNELYELSLVRPHRTVAFQGFSEGEVRAVDAAMLAPPLTDGALPPPVLPPLGEEDTRWGAVASPRSARGRGEAE